MRSASPPGGLELIEIAPGIDLERDLLAKMGFRPEIAPDLREMDAAIFGQEPLGLTQHPPLTLDARIEARAQDEPVRLTLDGLAIDTVGEAERAVRLLDRRLREIDGSDTVIVDCDGFEVDRPGAAPFLKLLREHERSHSWTWCCADALQRRKLTRAWADAGLGHWQWDSLQIPHNGHFRLVGMKAP